MQFHKQDIHANAVVMELTDKRRTWRYFHLDMRRTHRGQVAATRLHS